MLIHEEFDGGRREEERVREQLNLIQVLDDLGDTGVLRNVSLNVLDQELAN